MFNADKPINSFEEDRLGRGGFARQLGDAILQFGLTDNYAIGLYGEWGCGKTSIINMALAHIEEKSNEVSINERPIVIKFNPWNFTDCSQLINQFFVVISKKLRIENVSEKSAAVGNAIEKYSSALEYTEYIPVVGKYLKLVPTLFNRVGSTIKKNAEAKLNDVSYRKSEVEKALINLHTRILIVIDDIDRLPNDQIRLIFQLVNSVAGFPNVTYLLSFDKNIVVRALSEVQRCNGEEYLEKIIQVPFEVPKVNLDKVEGVLVDKLNNIIELPKYTEFDKGHWNEVFDNCIQPFIKSLRDVNRFYNTLYFQYSTIKYEVDFIDLCGITALQVFAPSIFNWIKNNKIILMVGAPSGKTTLDEDSKEREAILQDFKTVYSEDPECMFNAIESLFPNYFSDNFRRIFTNDFHRQKMRIACEDRFDIYFSLSIDEISIPHYVIERSIFEMNIEELHSNIDDLVNNGMIVSFFSELRCHFSRIPEDRIELFIRLLSYICGYLPWEGEGLLSLSAKRHSLFDLEKLLYKFEAEAKRYFELENLFRNSSFLSFQTLATLLNSIELSHGKLAANEPGGKQLINVDHLVILEKIFLERVKQYICEKDLLDWDEARMVSYLWECFDEKTYIEYLNKALNDDINVVKFLSIKAIRWNSSGIFGIEYEFKSSEYSKYISTEQIIKNINNARFNPKFWYLIPEQRDIAAAFILNMQKEDVSSYEIQFEQIRELVKQWEHEFKNSTNF